MPPKKRYSPSPHLPAGQICLFVFLNRGTRNSNNGFDSTTHAGCFAGSYPSGCLGSMLITRSITGLFLRQARKSSFAHQPYGMLAWNSFDRFEVLANFTSGLLAMLGVSYIAKESLELLLEPPLVHGCGRSSRRPSVGILGPIIILCALSHQGPFVFPESPRVCRRCGDHLSTRYR
jgi:hypothetical protein